MVGFVAAVGIFAIVGSSSQQNYAGLVYYSANNSSSQCGDGTCAASETCSSCSRDCGSCPTLTSSDTLANPLLLPVGAGTNGGSVPNVAAGQFYTDVFSGVRVWRVTDASTPVPNSQGRHDYANGPAQISRGWGA